MNQLQTDILRIALGLLDDWENDNTVLASSLLRALKKDGAPITEKILDLATIGSIEANWEIEDILTSYN